MTPAVANEQERFRIEAAYQRRSETVPVDRYSFFKQDNFLLHAELLGAILQRLRRANISELGSKVILDVGCGRGFWLRQFIQWGAQPSNLFGIDLLEERIADGKKLCPSGVALQCGDATRLNFEDHCFDLVLQFTVFTSILDSEMKRAIAQEMTRVLKPGGIILWYDYFISNPRNPDVRGVRANEIAELFPGLKITLKRITLAPPLGRLVGPASADLYRALSCCRFLCTHYLGFFQKL